MKHDTANPIYQHDTLEFVTVAAEYCAYVEQLDEKEPREFRSTMLKLLPLLYMKAQMLPQVESEGDFLPDDRVTEADYDRVRHGVYRLLGERDEHEALVYDEQTQTEECRWCTVSEALADTYQALRNFVFAYQQRVEPCMMDALWSVRDEFELYWGASLLRALGHLHHISYVLATSDDEEDIQ